MKKIVAKLKVVSTHLKTYPVRYALAAILVATGVTAAETDAVAASINTYTMILDAVLAYAG